jgi:hypothetical protein
MKIRSPRRPILNEPALAVDPMLGGSGDLSSCGLVAFGLTLSAGRRASVLGSRDLLETMMPMIALGTSATLFRLGSFEDVLTGSAGHTRWSPETGADPLQRRGRDRRSWRRSRRDRVETWTATRPNAGDRTREIIPFPLLGIGEKLVGGVDLLEARLILWIGAGDIGVMATG